MTKKMLPQIRHLVDMASLDTAAISYFFKAAKAFLERSVDAQKILDKYQGKIITNLFFEPSTRTRNSFIIAGERLGAMVLNPNMRMSATIKGESLIDTIHNFEAMGTDLFVIRHADNNTAAFVASELSSQASVINGGDGNNHHPTQALLDLFTIQQHKTAFSSLKVAIIGDILHSRVARSLIEGLNAMNTAHIRLVAPDALVPHDISEIPVEVFSTLKEGLDNVDVVVALRIQKERMQAVSLPDPEKFYQEFGLTAKTLAYAKSDAIVMHPGPINRGVEIDSAVADGPQSVILQQVRNGVAMRMAIMDCLLSQH